MTTFEGITMKTIKDFFALEASSGIVLLFSACLALLLVNSPLNAFYHTIFNERVLFWINDGLMVLFFLLISLELKRELVNGELSNKKNIILPAVAALGGMIIPALIYTAINYQSPDTSVGWAIPVATDIAFALGVLALVSKKLPYSLKIFLMSLAIFDDLGAIIIIAAFHSHEVSFFYIGLSDVVLIALGVLNYFRFKNLISYLILGIMLWYCILYSGIHPTIAGVLLGCTIPVGTQSHSPLQTLEHALHPVVSYLILPLFALANAGVLLTNINLSMIFNSVTLGITLGLFVGKQLGVFIFSWLIIKSGFVSKPKSATWLDLYGVSILCGIGFTMSLFLGTLAFGSSVYMDNVRLGVLLGSLLSGVIGGSVLLYSANLKV